MYTKVQYQLDIHYIPGLVKVLKWLDLLRIIRFSEGQTDSVYRGLLSIIPTMYNKIYNILKSVPSIKVRTYDYSVYQEIS